MLNNVAKLIERLVLSRLSRGVVDNDGLAHNQYGFCVGRGTFQAIQEVLDVADAAAAGVTRDRDLCLMVTLDVCKAFNTAPWKVINSAVLDKRVPNYLTALIRSYLSDLPSQAAMDTWR